MRHLALCFLAALTLALSAAPVRAADWSVLDGPGVIAVMRHALAPGGGDPVRFVVDDCTTQRNLNERGREQARRIGRELRDRGLTFDAVLSSRWCRCLGTATEMALGDVEPFEPLNSFFNDRADKDGQTEEVRRFLAAQGGRKRMMLVTHQVNITALTGIFPDSGEIVAIRVSEDGRVEVLGTVLVDP